MRRSKKKTLRMSILMLLLLLGIGYAALAANLKIDGLVNVSKSNWDVHFENVQITTGSVTATTVPTSDDTTTTEMSYAVNLTQPGDFYEFTVDIVNNGSIDAMINLVTNKIYQSDGTTEKVLPAYLRSVVTYSDGGAIIKNQILPKKNGNTKTVETIKVRVEFRTDINPVDLPGSAETTVFKFKADYKQADDTAIPVRVNFATDSWDAIVASYNAGSTAQLEQAMNNGTTREIEMDLDGNGTNETYHLRIANLSTPAECGQTGFSETACGFVVEFADAITSHIMSTEIIGDTTTTGVNSKGGWEYSDMRAFLNNGIYAYGNIDYSTTGIYNKLPSALKNKVINTTVVSGHNGYDDNNFTTTDKLYLLSSVEIWGGDKFGHDSAVNVTRQLDYYKSIGVTVSNYSGARKYTPSGAESWLWTRTPGSDTNASYYYTNEYGNCGTTTSEIDGGISPAFRLG